MASRRLSVVLNVSIIEEFKKEIQRHSLKTYDEDGRTFIRVQRLKNWLRADSNRIDELLGAAYRTDSPSLPISSKELLQDSGKLLIFSLLLDLDLGHFIDLFCGRGISDSKLPISKADVKKCFARAPATRCPPQEELETLTKRFVERQYAFCPARFENPYHREHDAQEILPIVERALLSDKGGTATIWQIAVPEDFVSSELKEKLGMSRFDRGDNNFGPCYHLALKTFSHDNVEYYDTERIAFSNLVEHQGMLRCFGHFDQQEQDEQLTHHLLLEYGQLDLDEYFFSNPRPTFPDQIADFWDRMCDLVEAVGNLHEFKGPRRDVSNYYYGWHADIKPDNILLVHGVFKLADPGFAGFMQKTIEEKLRQRNHTYNVRGGTTTYGAPECHKGRLSGGQASHKIDIWSLGCVFSLAATWIILDSSAIIDYDEFRKQALAQIANPAAVDQYQQVEAGDWFHDGTEVLPAVREWHNYLRLVVRHTDSLTTKLLDLVDDFMLCGEAKRKDARELSSHMKSLIADFRSSYKHQRLFTSESIPAEVQKLYAKRSQVVIDSAVPGRSAFKPSETRTLAPQEINPRKSRKSERFQNPLLLLHPSSARQPFPQTSTRYERRLQPVSDASVSEGSLKPSIGSSASRTNTSNDSVGPLSRTPTKLNNNRRQDSLLTLSDLQEQQRRKKKNSFFTRTIGTLKRKEKDAHLSKHFKNRDIHFLVDNGSTMAQFWDQTIELLQSLVQFARGQDPNGMDLSFTNGNEILRNCENPTKFTNAMRSAAPSHDLPVYTDIRDNLNTILNDYLRTSVVKPMVVIILTDGKWKGMRDPMAIRETIVDFHNNLGRRMKQALTGKQVGFEFVQIGDDEDARERLTYLDDKLWQDYNIADMIDTEHWKGSVHKIMLGSFVEWWDDRDTEQDSPQNGQRQDQRTPPGRDSAYFSDRTINTSPQMTFSNF